MTPAVVHIEDLARLLWTSEHGSPLLCMIAAYFDDSGTSTNSETLWVAGYISSVGCWEAFRKEWQDTLRHYNLTYFHATDFDCPQSDYYKRIKREDRIPLQKQLIQTIKLHTKVMVSGGVHKKDYEACRRFYNNHGPYAYIVYQCISGVAAWANENGYGGPIVYVFDKGGGSKELGRKAQLDELRDFILADDAESKRFRMDKVEAWTYAMVNETPALQAADIVAYESWKEFINAHLPVPINPRTSFGELLRSANIRTGYFDKDTLRGYQR